MWTRDRNPSSTFKWEGFGMNQGNTCCASHQRYSGPKQVFTLPRWHLPSAAEGRRHTSYMEDHSYDQGCTREARDVRGQVLGQPEETTTWEGSSEGR